MRAIAVLAFAVLIASVAARAPALEEVATYTFEQYEKDFRKKYATEEERAERRALFEASKKDVVQHNGCPKASKNYKKGINQFSDRTRDEFKRRLGGRLRRHYNEIQELKKTSLVRTHKLQNGVSDIPDSVDWRNRVPSIFSSIKDQGDCGSCWAHASTENLESHWALKTGQLFTLSQQQITACAPNPNDCGGVGGCGGSTAELAYAYVTKAGIAQEWTYPYTAYNGTTGTCRKPTDITPTDVSVNGYTAIPTNDQDAVMDAIARNGPLAVNVDASTWSAYSTGIYDGCTYNISIDHVVQLVGYGHDFSLNQDYWIIRNSWSPAWGENGYIRLIRHKTPTCGWDVDPQDGTGCNGGPAQLWSCGQCGVLFDTLYPNVIAN